MLSTYLMRTNSTEKFFDKGSSDWREKDNFQFKIESNVCIKRVQLWRFVVDKNFFYSPSNVSLFYHTQMVPCADLHYIQREDVNLFSLLLRLHSFYEP